MDAAELAAAEAEAGPSRREALAAQAQQQVLGLVQACHALLAAYGAAAAAARAGAPSDGGDGDGAATTAAAITEDIEHLHDLYVERRATCARPWSAAGPSGTARLARRRKEEKKRTSEQERRRP